jgi:hypothetical protein
VSGPAWLAAGFAVLMIMIAACRACRPAISRPRGKFTELGTDGLHVLMGAAMVYMLVPVGSWPSGRGAQMPMGA